MNETEIKTRLGLILENVLGEALKAARFSFAQDHQYDEACEKPDFLIPNEKKPKYMIEVHQTEARNSFQMKTLRAFTAVVEGKAHYGDNIITINVLFGAPEDELPAANVRAMCSFFDLNIVPRQEGKIHKSVAQIESAALTAAATEGCSIADASEKVIGGNVKQIKALSHLLKRSVQESMARKEMNPLWAMERARASAIGTAPAASNATYYKRLMLRALYLSDADFKELVQLKDPELCQQSVIDQLLAVGLVEVQEDLDRDAYLLESDFEEFLHDDDATRLRELCRVKLDDEPSMHWFFEDIRDHERRKIAATAFIDAYLAGEIEEKLQQNMLEDICCGIEHRRTWLLDLLIQSAGVSLNSLSRKIFSSGENQANLGDPVSHICPKTARFRGLPDNVKVSYVKDIFSAFQQTLSEQELDSPCLDAEMLADRLLALRLNGAIKLRKLDPLFLVSEGVCDALGLEQRKSTLPSVVSDLAGSRAAGRYEAYEITDGKKTVLMNAVAVHDSHGDDKSK